MDFAPIVYIIGYVNRLISILEHFMNVHCIMAESRIISIYQNIVKRLKLPPFTIFS